MKTTHMLEYFRIVVDLIKGLAWPGLALIIIRQFKGAIYDALTRSKTVNFKFAGVEIALSQEEAAVALSGYLDAVLTDTLKQKQRTLFLQILACPQMPTVESLLPGFFKDGKRDEASLTMLRALRGAALIRPFGGGSWEPNSLVEVTESGRFVGRYKRDLLEGKVTTANT